MVRLHDTAFNVDEVPSEGRWERSTKSTRSTLRLSEPPTAMHADGPLHDTPFRPSVVAGLGTTDHVDPFHDSFSVPTAAQNVEPLHDTPLRELYCVGGVAGLATTDHETPGLASAPTGVLATTIGTVATMNAGTNSLRALRPNTTNRRYE